MFFPTYLIASLAMAVLGQDVSLFADRPDATEETQQIAKAYAVAGATATVRNYSPIMSITINEDQHLRLRTLSFHRVLVTNAENERGYVWVARSRAADWTRISTRYADGRQCEDMSKVLVLASAIDLPVATLPGVPFNSGPRPGQLTGEDFAMDGPSFALSVTAAWPATNSLATVTVTGQESSPLGALASTAEALLAPCWSADLPADMRQ